MLNRLRIIERIDICRTHMRMSGAKLNHNRWPKNHALRPKGHRKRRLTVKKVSESACKPGSVKNSHSSGMYVAIHLKQPTRIQRGSRHADSYLVLLRVGFTMPLLLPAARCALTAPFHPYLCSRTNHRRSNLCGTFRRLSPPRRYLALYPMEPGLSSALFP